jgi:pimeloyl-ACP methyl ester carboxylesterase
MNDVTKTFSPFGPIAEYLVDAAQRTILFWDVMWQRGNQYLGHLADNAPPVLHYAVEPILSGQHLDRPVNYNLLRIIPPSGVALDPTRRPFVFIDPRAGHGPGIGGFKPESEIGVALKAGYPCYFVDFLPEPVPGQTIEDITRAEAIFLEQVIKRHPEAEGNPCVVGNCQAGWAVMMLAATRPKLCGPVILAGAPLSYWAGARGQNPMRYAGGLMGGSWITALLSDLGRGKFDGAWLIQNFEALNPSNTLWRKQYDLYANIDTKAARYLDFERWWGGHVNLNADEIQFIVDELFIGNNLAAGKIQSADGITVDLRNIRSPILIFCSDGDNITPPQQALGWILDLYDSVEEIRSYGQRIFYVIHASVGHLGIFVSSAVAGKEHDKFASNIVQIDLKVPGLYEIVFEAKTEKTANPHRVSGTADWVMRYEERTLDDIRALVGNDPEDDRRFATAARVSRINLALYRAFAQPIVRAVVNAPLAEWMRRMHPLRLQYQLFSDANPLLVPLGALAQQISEQRSPAAADNPCILLQDGASAQIAAALDAWRDLRDRFYELTFLSVYGSPMLQAAVGIDPARNIPMRQAGKSLEHLEQVEARIAELKSHIGAGGLLECQLRAILYVYMGDRMVDERVIDAARHLLVEQEGMESMTLVALGTLAHEQYSMLQIDTEATLAAIPSLLPADPQQRRKGFAIVREVISAAGVIGDAAENRMRRIARLFGIDETETGTPAVAPPMTQRTEASGL